MIRHNYWVNPSAGGPAVAFPNGMEIAWNGTSVIANSVTLPFTPGNIAIIP
jgi:hypothetical protein